jgi:predicted MFS family arabinose efflux permease
VVLMGYGLFTAATPHLLMIAVLLLGGFLRSLQFTSLSAITYAELEPRQVGAATAIASVAQQVSVSLGVATGAMVLEISEWVSGREHPVTADFAAAFVAVGLVSSLCSVLMVRLPAAAGDEISGRAIPPAEPEQAPRV